MCGAATDLDTCFHEDLLQSLEAQYASDFSESEAEAIDEAVAALIEETEQARVVPAFDVYAFKDVPLRGCNTKVNAEYAELVQTKGLSSGVANLTKENLDIHWPFHAKNAIHATIRAFRLARVGSVWCVVCGVWCVMCDVWCVVCGVWC